MRLQQLPVVLSETNYCREKYIVFRDRAVLESYSLQLGYLAQVIEPLEEKNLTFLSVKAPNIGLW